ncbi:hypothetical protein GOD78_26860 [Sinorhizobium medicae]|uniref:hypothetical protein n=1 Tax=Sinorhizobium medicae TaxID=110321 RepID=UPI00035F875B|nr:hypothetical protein [Sinorhizobium medicae]MDX0604756.1 hypothetical protein [Sinorhizobium medicae]MDX0821060.1 hypothetical protein [Sinorhizobium medicae]MDX0865099.1 hypothetical protein [Sinorhizobium medicae]RVJ16215.1 hypothetical protein CN179_33095 [Sinorhizobium medicae]UFX06508.1 hypothetical protein SmedWSM1115_33860 [Sinorhizobium medicae WSM1115]
MKAPWKYLARLTSRRPSAEAQESPVGKDTAPKTLESEGEHTSALPPNSTAGVSPPAHEEDLSADQGSVASDKVKADDDVATHALKPPIDAEEAQTPTRDEVDHRGPEAFSTVPKSTANTKSQSKPRIKRRGRGKRANGHVAAQSVVAPKHHQSLPPLSPRELFFHDAATLDKESNMLTTQLAQKLHLQNVQLKKMLERFEVS